MKQSLLFMILTLILVPAGANSLHPDITLFDSDGRPVIHSNAPLSVATTCGDCHDTAYIEANHDHPALIAANCLLCHSEGYDAEQFFSVRLTSDNLWAEARGLDWFNVLNGSDQWQSDLIEPDGSVTAELLGVTAARSSACGQCHGIVHNSHDPLVIDEQNVIGRLTGKEGAIFSAQRIDRSGLNIAGKSALTRSFDVHAERLLECTDCHRAANNPVFGGAHGTEPEHLAYDPRQIDLNAFLERPDHNLAMGHAQGDGECRGCHLPDDNHDWLAETETHMQALACQACHIPELFGPAVASRDATQRNAAGNSLTLRREQFTPLLLPRERDGKWAPFNVQITHYWRDGFSQTSVSADTVDQAWRQAGLTGAHPERALDDGAQAQLVTQLQALGVTDPQRASQVRIFPVSHGVTRDDFALSDCDECHSVNGRLNAALPLGAAPADFQMSASLIDNDNPVIRLYVDDSAQLMAQSAVQGDFELSRRWSVTFVAGFMIFAVGGLGLIKRIFLRRRSS